MIMKQGRISIARTMVGMFICMTLGLFACLPDPLDVSGIPKVKPEIVVSSQITSDESLVVFLTRTFSALDASDDSDPETVWNAIAVNDAAVTITHNGVTDTLIRLAPGTYGGTPINFESGVRYTLRAESPTLGMVTASTEVKPRIAFDDLVAELYFDGFNDTLAQISYRIDDPVEKNWYMVNVLDINREDVQRNLLNPRDFTRLLNDDEFNGIKYTETFRVFPREFSAGDTIAVYLSNISEEYYRYMETRLENRFGLFEFVSEPVNYSTNVIGGRGFFNLYIPDIHFIILE